MSETDYSGESDFDIVLPPEKATAAHHVTAENLQEDVPVKHTIVLEKKEKVKKKIFEYREKRRESETWKRNKASIAREKEESKLEGDKGEYKDMPRLSLEYPAEKHKQSV
ncbi:hypothetical protein ILUMI_06585 [Ignelater luminosus]|uniref:Uncharacterized protein n=1 Tax=Ignelater luminosus TaxID=2038154 RepID=A0A8K0D5G9_IGNLU|nr:hypothetical protein ILUMI_06585 [Ignelater luminosus]